MWSEDTLHTTHHHLLRYEFNCVSSAVLAATLGLGFLGRWLPNLLLSNNNNAVVQTLLVLSRLRTRIRRLTGDHQCCELHESLPLRYTESG
jgi:hypothetical protein